MKIIESNKIEEVELPLQLNIFFKKVYVMFEKYAYNDFKNHPFHSSSIKMVDLFNKNPELNDGFLVLR